MLASLSPESQQQQTNAHIQSARALRHSIIADQTRELAKAIAKSFIPPRHVHLDEWAEREIVLSSEYANKSAGPLKLHGWQREIFRAYSDPAVREIVCMVSTQMVKTILIQASIAYTVKCDPGPILLVQPTEEDAKGFSKERITPMIRDCDCLRGLISDAEHDAKNTILTKVFPGGQLSMVSAQKPGNMARRSIRYLYCDEIDKYPPSAGKEGDPIDLATKRLATFGSRTKKILTCSPTMAGSSRIAKAYADSDQRRPWVTCPTCSHQQILKWNQVKFDMGLLDKNAIANSAYYKCSNPDCTARWDDATLLRVSQAAVWKADKPFNGIAGFWISHLYSPWRPLQSLQNLVAEFLRVKDDPDRHKTFVNTTLAELWEEKGETPDAELIYARRESYHHGDEAIVPQRGLFLTAGVDVQDSPPRLECEVVAWGRNRENWSMGYWVLQRFAENGEPLPVTTKEIWDDLGDLLRRQWLHESGHFLSIWAMGIDTGSRPKPVYDFALLNSRMSFNPATGAKVPQLRSVIPVKGNDDAHKILSAISKEDAARKRQNIRILTVGTHNAKQYIYDMLKAVRPDANGKPKANCFHHPLYAKEYFDMLCSELRVTKENGDIVYVKRAGMRNEALDAKVYNLAMAALVGIDNFREQHWLQLEERLRPMTVEDETAEEVAQVGNNPQPVTPTPPTRPAQPPPTQPVKPTYQPPKREVRGRFF